MSNIFTSKENRNVILKEHEPYALDFKSSIQVIGNSEIGAGMDCLQIRRLSQHVPLANSSSSPFQSAVASVQFFYESMGQSHGPLMVCMSGGLDSQAMLHAFQESGVPFQVAILKMHQNFNSVDFGGALDICDFYGLSPQVVDLDAIDFFESGLYESVAKSAKTSSPLFAMHAYFAEKLPGIPIFAGEPWYHVRGTDSYKGLYVPDYKEYATEIYLQNSGRKCVSHFFEISLQMLVQFFEHESWRSRTVEDKNPAETYRSKYFAYRKSGFPMIVPASFVKQHGFEKLYLYYQLKYGSNNFYHFNDIFRRPLEKYFPEPTRHHFDVDESIPTSVRQALTS